MNLGFSLLGDRLKYYFVLITFSLSGLACPDFDGSYFCTSGTGDQQYSYQMEIKSSLNTKPVVYDFLPSVGESFQMKSDGDLHRINSQETYRSTCIPDSKKVNYIYVSENSNASYRVETYFNLWKSDEGFHSEGIRIHFKNKKVTKSEDIRNLCHLLKE